MDDSTSVKKTAEEVKEEEELAKKVNATLAEEEEKERLEEEEKRKKKQGEDQEKKQDETPKKRLEKEKKGAGQEKRSGTGDTEEKGQDEACPTFNHTCPEVTKCPICELCPECRPCLAPEVCPEPKDCPEVEVCPPECDPCPPIKCQTCGPETVDNATVCQECPAPPSCVEAAGMTVPVAMLVGASASLLFIGIAAIIGLLLRYVSPIASGFIFVATLVIIWYLSSHYPETARELGGRAATLLREAATALSHRIMAAIRHHDQVSFPNKPELFLRLSSMFHLKVCTKIFYVVEINF